MTLDIKAAFKYIFMLFLKSQFFSHFDLIKHFINDLINIYYKYRYVRQTFLSHI